jgi:ATP-dependent RNA/DNA helicase IGHMBP2
MKDQQLLVFFLSFKMEKTNPAIQHFLSCIDLEDQEQAKRFQLNETHSLKALKAEGLALHPIRITRKSFGYADYPELSFKLPFPGETNAFKNGMAIECFCQGEEPIKGMLLSLDGKNGEFRLFAPDFPDWIEDDGVGIKLTPDTRTSSIMKKALADLPQHPQAFSLFQQVHDKEIEALKESSFNPLVALPFFNQQLNESQQIAVQKMHALTEGVFVLHGPPGTGKTTTLLEGIQQLVKAGQKIMVTAPSNTAVDNIAQGLVATGINFLRIGNNTKVNAAIFPFTPEGKLKESKQEKEIKRLKIRAEEMRKMAYQYKRRFGKDERDQKKLLLNEVKAIRKQIKDIQHYNEEELFTKASVILGTPIGLMDTHLAEHAIDTLIMDEAGQCLEPLAWCVMTTATKIILAGDHLQLPPTVLSNKAQQLGFNISILERFISKIPTAHLLDTQYRMREAIVQFPNTYFYAGLLKTAQHLASTGAHLYFYDTAGAGYNEETGQDGNSLTNPGELDACNKIIELLQLNCSATAFISPYSGQVAAAKETLPHTLKISTIDSFQGQEAETILLSLVRSNESNQIGFLSDYRRMNVAMTRAKECLIIIGDSTTLAKDDFYNQFLNYVEAIDAYKSVWELG